MLVVTNWSTLFEKHKTIEIKIMIDFLRIFKNIAFFKKVDFFNSPEAHAKIVKCTLSNQSFVGQTQ